MLPSVATGAGLLVLTAAAIRDHRTGLINDWHTATAALLGIIAYTFHSINAGTVAPLLYSLSVGVLYGLVGLYMNRINLWGDGDIFYLAAAGILVPYGHIYTLLLIMALYLLFYLYQYRLKEKETAAFSPVILAGILLTVLI